jgi:hypothetical protein
MSAAYPRQIFIYETGAAAAELQMLSRQKLADMLAGRQALLPQVQQTQAQSQTVLIKFQTHKSDYNLN